MRNFFILILLSASISSFAQNHMIGIIAGMSCTNVRAKEDYLKDTKYRNSYTLGFTYEHQGKKHFNFGVDVMYYRRGFQNRLTFPQLEYKAIVNSSDKTYLMHSYNYIALPLKCGFSTTNKVSAFINIGLIPSFVVNAKTSTESEIFIRYWDSEYNRDVTDDLSKFDLAGLIEFGTSINLSNRIVFSASFSYQHSVTTVSNANYHYGTGMKNYGIVLTGGIKYVLSDD